MILCHGVLGYGVLLGASLIMLCRFDGFSKFLGDF